MPVMSVGQVAEILTMLILGVTLKTLGWRKTMIVGILGHAARFGVYALLPAERDSDCDRTDSSWDLLRVFLRDRLYLRGRVLPEGCAGERARIVLT